MNIVNESEVREAIRYKCFLMKGQKHFAKQLDVSQAFVSAVINGLKSPTDEMLKAIGYEARYVKLAEPKDSA